MKPWFLWALLPFLASCAVGPDYRKPDVDMPAAWKEAADWNLAQPADTAPKGKWWEEIGRASCRERV